ncbi:MAG TPA: Fe-S cluster assembly protein SufD [Clostridiales bacterium]|nr:Fe-S cluster assembly protein SufD [Clostridiales bacterium]
MSNNLRNINPTPVRTWSWLGVNDITIDDNLSHIDALDNNASYQVFHDNNINVKLESMSDDYNSQEVLKNIEFRGISEEANNQVLKNYNSGFYIEAGESQRIKELIRIDYVLDREQSELVDNNGIYAKENSEVTVVVNYMSKDELKGTHNGLFRVYGEKGAKINLIILQNLSEESTHLNTCVANLEDKATINYTIVELGAKNTVSNLVTNLQGDESSSNVHTVYMGDKEKVIDINYIVNHFGRETKSNIEVKGVLQDKCKKTFKGTIDFKKGSAKSVGKEDEYTVLLSDEIRNRSVPMLLCREDDVSGEHAASSGKIDEDKLFYLMTRGFSKAEAKKLIIEAAINPIIDLIPDEESRNLIYEGVRRRLKDEQ